MKKFFAFAAALMMSTSVFSYDVAAEEEKPEIDETKWHMSVHKAADAVLTDDGKEYTVVINNPGGESNGGADKWDVQFRCRGISVEEGHEYTVTYKISSSNAGYYYTKISNLDSVTVGDAIAGEVWHNQYGVSDVISYADGIIKSNKDTNYGDAWNMQSISKGDTINVTCTFTSNVSMPEAEWAFFLGGAGPATPTGCFEAGTVLRFSNLTLTDNTSGEKIISDYEFIKSDICGDIDGNGISDLVDMTMLCMYILKDMELDDVQMANADVNADGDVNVADIAHFKQYLSGMDVVLGKSK